MRTLKEWAVPGVLFVAGAAATVAAMEATVAIDRRILRQRAATPFTTAELAEIKSIIEKGHITEEEIVTLSSGARVRVGRMRQDAVAETATEPNAADAEPNNEPTPADPEAAR